MSQLFINKCYIFTTIKFSCFPKFSRKEKRLGQTGPTFLHYLTHYNEYQEIWKMRRYSFNKCSVIHLFHNSVYILAMNSHLLVQLHITPNCMEKEASLQWNRKGKGTRQYYVGEEFRNLRKRNYACIHHTSNPRTLVTMSSSPCRWWTLFQNLGFLQILYVRLFWKEIKKGG